MYGDGSDLSHLQLLGEKKKAQQLAPGQQGSEVIFRDVDDKHYI